MLVGYLVKCYSLHIISDLISKEYPGSFEQLHVLQVGTMEQFATVILLF